ncbi:hypothetical protein [Paractinoplanes toevensis]|uniref:Uncharacterized protein n=1 Tax=Paractinoplanes toevensis TaxID=571911 RepID=A0A919T5S4_9ACTN|nr:hypothetical protein [Actinoplanes toevensis]GIM88887.1 hypothetical protein Ato02nite_006800 [Actinoplanes toevensis]
MTQTPKPAAKLVLVTTHRIFDWDVDPGEHYLVSADGREGSAYFVVCKNGDNWYVDGENKKHPTPKKSQAARIFGSLNPGTSRQHRPPPY